MYIHGAGLDCILNDGGLSFFFFVIFSASVDNLSLFSIPVPLCTFMAPVSTAFCFSEYRMSGEKERRKGDDCRDECAAHESRFRSASGDQLRE